MGVDGLVWCSSRYELFPEDALSGLGQSRHEIAVQLRRNSASRLLLELVKSKGPTDLPRHHARELTHRAYGDTIPQLVERNVRRGPFRFTVLDGRRRPEPILDFREFARITRSARRSKDASCFFGRQIIPRNPTLK